MKKIIQVVLISCMCFIFTTFLLQKSAYSISNPQEEITYAQLEGPYVQGQVEPGKSYYLHKYEGENEVDIEYIAGNLPIIISVPHGGNQKPNEISNRSSGWFSGGNINSDVYTVPLAYQIKNAIYDKIGGYPHIIICRLDRIKIDLNRDKSSGWASDSRVQIAWNDFHALIDLAKQAAIDQTRAGDMENSGFGFYIDLHGQPYSLIMIGNGISGYNLKKSDDHINGMVDNSSFKDLFHRFNKTGQSFASLIRGEKSFGALIEKYGVPLSGDDMLCVPSPSKPKPGNVFYSGHYNLGRHTHMLDEFKKDFIQISGIQLECNKEVRKYYRKELSQAIALSLIDFFDFHYGLYLEDLIGPGLDAPEGVAASDGDYDYSIVVQWDSVPDASYYKVYRSDSIHGTYSQIGEDIFEPATSYSDEGLISGDSFYYRVKAVNDEFESGLSKYDKGSTFAREIVLLKDDFESNDWNANWTGNWVQSSQHAYNGSNSAKANRSYDGYFTTDDLDTGSATSITVDFWFRKHLTDVGEDIFLYYFDGKKYNQIADLDTFGGDFEWIHYVDTITDSAYFIENFKIKLDADNLSGSYWYGYEKVYLDDVIIRITKN